MRGRMLRSRGLGRGVPQLGLFDAWSTSIYSEDQAKASRFPETAKKTVGGADGCSATCTTLFTNAESLPPCPCLIDIIAYAPRSFPS